MSRSPIVSGSFFLSVVFLVSFLAGAVWSCWSVVVWSCASAAKDFNENAWELYNLNEDYTERIDLAKKYPEKLAELKAEFEDQAKAHHLYPYITWDDVLKGRIHRTKGSKSFLDAVKDVTKSSDGK